MKYGTALAALGILCGAVGTAPAAQATPGPPCVTKGEYRDLSNYQERRKAVETFWGVRGAGRREHRSLDTIAVVVPNTHAVKYRVCGQRLSEAWVDVFYTNNTRQLDEVTVWWTNRTTPAQRVTRLRG